MSRTLFDKVWDDHVIHDFGGGDYLLSVDRHWLNDGAFHTFEELDRRELTVRNPELTFAVIDHLIETQPGRTYESRLPNGSLFAQGTIDGCRRHSIRLIGIDDPRHGISHIISPEMGVTLPGTLLVCTDGHTCTNGAFGSYAIGFGSSGGTHTLATQTLIARRPKRMRVTLAGQLDGASAKDVVLGLIGRYSARGGKGHVIEYAGPVVDEMSMHDRMTICNMSVEFGATTAMVAPDATTYEYLEGNEFSPKGAAWDQAVAYWETLRSDDNAEFDAELTVDCSDLAPQVTWGTSPEDVLPVDGVVPNLADEDDEVQRRTRERSLEYMGLTPGTRLEGLEIGAAFIGSCTNARLDDLQIAAEFLRGRHVADGVRAICVPGSASVRRAAEAEGLDVVFKDAGFEWHEAGCSMCTSSGVDVIAPGTRMISSTNRNFENRQGPGVRTHLASPATVAASAIAGHIADTRRVTAGSPT